MSVDKPLRTPDSILSSMGREHTSSTRSPSYGLPEQPGDEVEVEFEGMDDISSLTEDNAQVTELPDGGVEISLQDEDEPAAGGFDANLAETLPDDVIQSILSECIEAYDADINSRKDWETMAAKGLRLLGMHSEDRNDPWENASGVFHPLLLEAVIRFWAKACKDLSPPGGPAKAKVKGAPDPAKTRRAQRVKDEINYIITEKIEGYRDEQSRMVFNLGLLGSAFKKIWFDPASGSIQNKFVHPQDLIAPYNTTNLKACPRYCHRTRMFPSEIIRLMEAGVYREVPLGEITSPQQTEIESKQNEISGERPSSKGGQHVILEYYIDLAIPGEGEGDNDEIRPYCVTIDHDEQVILSIRRHWEESDPKRKRICYFVTYQYIPGFSIYALGLVHMIGALAEGATGIMRQLIDAGTLSNLPAGFKAKGFRVKGDDRPLKPGEFRDVDIPGMKIADGFMTLPFKEPSVVLAGLLENIVQEARRVGSVADVSASDVSSETPVGTTLALLEESMVIQSSIQTNLLASLAVELDIIKGLVQLLPPEYEYAVSDGANRHEDFSDISIIPVADPNASSMAQKVVAYQEMINLSAQAPQVYNLNKLHRGMAEALQIPNAEEIVPLEDDLKPSDPVTENMNILRGKPVRVFSWQEHEAHIAVHVAAAMDPAIQQVVGQSPMASSIQGALMAHINEHVAWAYRARIEQQLGQALPDPELPVPQELEGKMAPALAQAAKSLLQQSQQQKAQEQAQQTVEDPLFKLQAKELQIKEMDQVRKAQTDAARIEADSDKARMQAQVQMLKILSDAGIADMDRMQDALLAARDLEANTALEHLKVSASVHNQRESNMSRERSAANSAKAKASRSKAEK